MTGPDGGRSEHHDPTARYPRATPARSAPTLRLVLASFGLVVSAAIAVLALATDGPAWLAVLGLVLVVAPSSTSWWSPGASAGENPAGSWAQWSLPVTDPSSAIPPDQVAVDQMSCWCHRAVSAPGDITTGRGATPADTPIR